MPRERVERHFLYVLCNLLKINEILPPPRFA